MPTALHLTPKLLMLTSTNRCESIIPPPIGPHSLYNCISPPVHWPPPTSQHHTPVVSSSAKPHSVQTPAHVFTPPLLSINGCRPSRHIPSHPNLARRPRPHHGLRDRYTRHAQHQRRGAAARPTRRRKSERRTGNMVEPLDWHRADCTGGDLDPRSDCVGRDFEQKIDFLCGASGTTIFSFAQFPLHTC
jgi:hypothetical protein